MNKAIVLLLTVILVSCNCKNRNKETGKPVILKKGAFEKVIDGKQVSLYTLENKNGMKVVFTNFGARVVSLLAPDQEGKLGDVVLGFDNIDTYVKEDMYLGSTVGRYANRIDDAVITIDGVEYKLSVNDGKNCLHGGNIGFDKVVWDATSEGNSITFSYLSEDGEQGFPGNVNVQTKYTLTDDNELKIEYEAETDKATVVNLSHHSYFNLKGEGDTTILDHYLMIDADRYTPVDKTLIPTGELAPVANTPFDFTKGKKIGRDIDLKDKQLYYGLGYDHNWVLNQEKEKEVILAAKLWEETTGRVMEIYTDEPGIQFYCGNFMDGSYTGKSGKKYVYRSGVALETQHFPNSPNEPGFPSTVLKPGEKYTQLCIYKFGILKK